MENWKSETAFIVVIAIIAFVIGLSVGAPFTALGFAAIGLLFWHFNQLSKLQRWLDGPASAEPPLGTGQWQNIFERIYQREQRARKERERIRAELNHLHLSFAALPDAVVMLDAGNIIEWGNEASKRLLGLRFPLDTNLPLTNLIRSPEFRAYLVSGDFSKAFELRSPSNPELRLKLQLTEFGEFHKILFARDVTAVRQTERIRKDFIANVSHELRTPLTVISGYLETMDDWAKDNAPQWNKPLVQMRGNASRMENLIKDLILLSRLESMEEWGDRPEDTVHIRPVLESICQNALNSVGDREITIDCHDDLFFRGYLVELESIFSNLIFNAARYTSEGGHIAVKFKAMPDNIVFSVEDDGVGIPPHHIPRLSERFYRVDEGRSTETGGTGLGLAIVKHALRRYDGALEITSSYGRGSTFSCRLPVDRVSHQGSKQQAS